MPNKESVPAGKPRETVYDWLRLIATLLVVLGHSFYLSNHTAIGSIDYVLPEAAAGHFAGGLLFLLDRASHFVYFFHMPLFFILSGAVLALKPIPDLRKFTLSKVKRLLVPYWIYSFFYMLPVKYLAGFYEGYTVPQVLWSFLKGGEDGHLWFLPALFFCMLLFAGLRKLLQRWTDSTLVPLAVCLVLAPLFGAPPGSVVQFRTGISYLSYFAVGYWLQDLRNRRKPETPVQVFLMAAAALAGTGICFVLGKSGSFLGVLSISALLLCVSWFCVRLLKAFERTGFWSFLMRNLFYIYIFHDPMEYVVLKVFMRPGMLESAGQCWLMVGLRFAGTLVLSLLLGECICRLKAHFTAKKKTAAICS